MQDTIRTYFFTYGKINLHLNLGFRRTIYHNFVMADVKEPKLDAEFLEIFNLTLKMSKQIVKMKKQGYV